MIRVVVLAQATQDMDTEEMSDNVAYLCNRAVQLEMGLTGAPNYEEAASFYRRAAKLGSVFAKKKIEKLQEEGLIDENEADEWEAPDTGDFSSLEDIVSEIQGQQAGYRPQALKKKILIVDDGEDTRMILKKILKLQGYVPLEAADGREAIRLLSENPDIACIFLDLSMPNMNGFQFLERIGSKKGDLTTKIVVLTSYTDPKLVLKGKSLKIHGWLMKPVDKNKVIDTLDNLLEEKKS